MDGDGTHRVRVELDVICDSHRIRGTGTVDDGAIREFVGWMELLRLLESALGAPPLDAAK